MNLCVEAVESELAEQVISEAAFFVILWFKATNEEMSNPRGGSVTMHSTLRSFAPIALAAALVSPAMMTGCSVHARVYDPYYHDYHPWDGEVVYYNQWEHDTHRDHVDFARRNPGDQKAYWDWRHGQH